MLQKAGGVFTLTNDVNFGASYGLVALYLKSTATNIAQSGVVRLGNADKVAFRNSGNTADLSMGLGASDEIQFNSIDLADVSSAQTLTNKVIDGNSNTISNVPASAISNLTSANLSASAAIAFSQLAALPSGSLLVGSASNVATAIALSGAISINSSGVTTYAGVVPLNMGGTGVAAGSANAAFNALSPLTSVGDLIVGGASGAGTRLAGNTTTAKQFLTQTGTGSASATPAWGAIQSSDVPTLNQNTTGTAANVTGIVAPANGGTGVANNAASTLTISGAHPVDLTVSASTNVTLPASGTLSTLGGVETLTNKTIGDTLIMSEQGPTPTTPPTGYLRVYPKTDHNLYTLNSSGVEVAVGAGGGSGGTGKNYLSAYNGNTGNGDFEKGSTTGWALFNTTLTGVVPTGSPFAGASSIGTFTTVSSGQLAGKYSLEIASAGAISAGQGFLSDTFTIDTEDQSKVLGFSFYYSVTAGASNLNLSGSSSNTLAVYIYDNTNSAWIQPAGVYNLNQNAGVGLCTGTFQTTSNSTTYKLAIICVNASAGAATLYFDDFSVGPQATVSAPAISDMVAFTPTITSTGTSPTLGTHTWTAYYKRVGDSALITATLLQTSAGSAGTGAYEFSMPPGLVIDTTKTPVNSSVGIAQLNNGNGPYLTGNSYVYNSVNLALSTVNGSATNPGGVNLGSGSEYTPAGSTYYLSFTALVPIVGWSSNSVMSQDTDTRVVAFAANTATGTVYSTDHVVGWTAVTDTHAAFSTNTYTIPVSGNYYIEASLRIDGTFSVGNDAEASIYINGSAAVYGMDRAGGAQISLFPQVSRIFALKAGDTVQIYMSSAGGGTTLSSSSTYSAFSIMRLSGPAVVAASESVNARANTATSTIGTSDSLVTFTATSFDSHGAYNSGKYTAPVSGKYRVSALVTTAGVTLSTSQSAALNLYKNGSSYSALAVAIGSGGSSISYRLTGTDLIQLNAGDYVSIYANSAVATTCASGASSNYLTIERIGN
jgi:hypothetical protein